MRWHKLGQIYVPEESGRHPKLLTHAANPLAVHMHDDVYRIFYSGRDINSCSSVGAVDIDIVRKEIVTDHREPFFTHGPKGSFYERGVSIGNCYVANGVQYMLFMGWQIPDGGHWRGDVGRLIVSDDLTLSLDSEAPFLASDDTDPISLSYPWVQWCAEKNEYLMWYGSTKTWDAGNDEMIHTINLATSSDGDNWLRKGLAVPYELGVAQAFSRPTVIGDSETGYQMWFSYRSGTGEKYRIGHAVSRDGYEWDLRVSDPGIDVSSSGWDSEMIEYPFVFEHKGEVYMFYNGNGYGETGIGLALLGE